MLLTSCRLPEASLCSSQLEAAALRLAQAQVGPETGGHLNAAPRTNDSTRIARNR